MPSYLRESLSDDAPQALYSCPECARKIQPLGIGMIRSYQSAIHIGCGHLYNEKKAKLSCTQIGKP